MTLRGTVSEVQLVLLHEATAHSVRCQAGHALVQAD